MLNLTDPIFTDENAARERLESIRWPDGPVCPRCGEQEVTKLKGKSTRPGVYKCRPCKKPFSVTVGTLYERSHIPLNKWLAATYLLCASKKGMSAHQLHRMLDITYKSAWFMAHRIRESMREGDLTPMGGEGEVIEADETYFGNKRPRKVETTPTGRKVKERGYRHKHTILSLVERGGNARSFHIDAANGETIKPIIFQNVSRESRLETDQANFYKPLGRQFKGGHHSVNHGIGEYVRGDHHTNTIESFFSVFKRGMRGIYQHCGEQHLHRYLAEFDFRYNRRKITDSERAEDALRSIGGRRLTYRGTH